MIAVLKRYQGILLTFRTKGKLQSKMYNDFIYVKIGNVPTDKYQDRLKSIAIEKVKVGPYR